MRERWFDGMVFGLFNVVLTAVAGLAVIATSISTSITVNV